MATKITKIAVTVVCRYLSRNPREYPREPKIAKLWVCG